MRNSLCAVCLSDLAPGEEDVRKKVEVVAGQVMEALNEEKEWIWYQSIECYRAFNKILKLNWFK